MNKKYLVDLTHNYEEPNNSLHKIFKSKYTVGNIDFDSALPIVGLLVKFKKRTYITSTKFCSNFYLYTAILFHYSRYINYDTRPVPVQRMSDIFELYEL